MKWILVLCALLAVSNLVSCRPDKDKDPNYEDVLNDDEGYGNFGEDGDDDLEDDGDDEEQSDPPIIKTKPRTFDQSEGDTVILPCDTENAESYSVMWKVNGVMIYQDKIRVGQRNDRFHRYDNQSLQIKQIKSSDGGDYECSISTSPLIFVKHRLNVLTPARIIKAVANKKASLSIQRGEALELECFAEGNPVPKVSWSMKGHRVSAEHVEYGTSRVYKQNIGRDDSGIYMCMAENENQRHPVIESVHVEVTHKPDMRIEKVIAGETELQLICRVHATPNADVTWIRKNKPVKTNENLLVDHPPQSHDHILTFKKMDESTFGNYSCSARNTYGQVEKHVNINGAPFAPKYETHRYVGDNNGLITKWTILSLAPITKTQLQYRKKGDASKTWSTETNSMIENEGLSSEFEHLSTLADGVYEARLRAENKYGWSEYSRAVSVEGKPAAYSISKKDDPAVDQTEEPESSTDFGSRTISSWTTILLVVLLNMYRSFV